MIHDNISAGEIIQSLCFVGRKRINRSLTASNSLSTYQKAPSFLWYSFLPQLIPPNRKVERKLFPLGSFLNPLSVFAASTICLHLSDLAWLLSGLEFPYIPNFFCCYLTREALNSLRVFSNFYLCSYIVVRYAPKCLNSLTHSKLYLYILSDSIYSLLLDDMHIFSLYPG